MTSDIGERLRTVPWHEIRQSDGAADGVPDALLALAAAREPADVRAAYWRLDNHVVVQGSLYEAAYHLVPFLLELLADRSRASRTALYDLLVEIAAGSPAFPGEVVTMPDGTIADLRQACRARIRSGLGVVRADLLDGATRPAILERALDLLFLAEPDRAVIREILSQVPDGGDGVFSRRVRDILERWS